MLERMFHGDKRPHPLHELPPPPPWRKFQKGKLGEPRKLPAADPRGEVYATDPKDVDVVNAAILLRRPLMITGKPGTGKTTLAYAIAHELELGPVLVWPITTRTTLADGLYHYDAIGRLQDASLDKKGASAPDLGQYIKLGPLGTALLPARRPRVLLIDEIDKSDVDLPNDLLHVFEEGYFEIPELARLSDREQNSEIRVRPADAAPGETVPIRNGRVECYEFPIVVLTSNGEREFPPAFNRRCLRVDLGQPSDEKLAQIVELKLGPDAASQAKTLIAQFVARRDKEELATDQLLNAIKLVLSGIELQPEDALWKVVFRPLSSTGAP